ncbi:MAG: heme-copper oxidase subunit III [Acidobacteriota bacterium]|nr:heme-copper oxidase subunit III [Acidobacteriota bacterium]
MSTETAIPIDAMEEWKLPDKGKMGMICLIIAESAIFSIFVVAYIFYIGKSLSGPTPAQVLTLPILGTVCLLSSSLTVHFAVSALEKGKARLSTLWLAATVILGAAFLTGTGTEWHKLIYHDGLTIRTNLFGTTFYSLVGLHASHVAVGLVMLSVALAFGIAGKLKSHHAHRLDALSYYWHFVDAVWVVVFTVVYVLGR